MRSQTFNNILLMASIGLVLCLFGAGFNAHAGVKKFQKISDTEGGFTGYLGDNDRFGRAATVVGDLDNDGVPDLAVGAYLYDYGDEQPGAVFILFMNADGTVKSQQIITEHQGGFDVKLDIWDEFASVEALGDLDGDGVPDLAVGARLDDDAGFNAGAVWILFLNTDGTVKSYTKITEGIGGFTGDLAPEDWFGSTLGNLGDFDGDGVVDVVVSAPYATGDYDHSGAVWILYLKPDGTVKGYQKIDDTVGGFTGDLDPGDRFGSSVSSLGDLDEDGVTDIAVGAMFDDDAGENTGAVWILFLNGDGTVKSHQKITEGVGGFYGDLDPEDLFGGGVVWLGFNAGYDAEMVAVGAALDDDGVDDAGAIWLLYLNDDGKVKDYEKISATEGGFTADLDYNDALTVRGSLGDFDGDGMVDLIAGARLDDDGGYNHGAIYLMFLGDCLVVPQFIDFGQVAFGNYRDEVFTVTNRGTTPVGGDITEDCDGFSIVSGGGPFSLPGGSSFEVTVRFEPTTGGRHECLVDLGTPLCAGVELVGDGMDVCAVHPDYLDFGSVAVGHSKDMTFSIIYPGTHVLHGNVSLPSCSQFSIVSGGGPFSLNPGDTLEVTVRFAPWYDGPSTCVVETGTASCSDVTVTGVGAATPPVIAWIRDVENDEGRQVRINFTKCSKDGSEYWYDQIVQYEAFRRIDPMPSLVSDLGEDFATKRVEDARDRGMKSDTGILLEGWDFAGAVPAHGEWEYNMIAPTMADSTADHGIHWSVFFIRAATHNSTVFYDSPLDSGYSVDNSPPEAPEGFIVEYQNGDKTRLEWQPSGNLDFGAFRIYRGLDPDFGVSRESLVHETTGTEWIDPAGLDLSHYYKLTSVDIAGNESEPVSPVNIVAPTNVPARFALYQNTPNPFNPTTTVRYDVASDGMISLRIYDVRGRLVRTLVDEFQAAGEKTVSWDGTNLRGQKVASGVYFCRFEAPGYIRTLKMLLLE